MTASDPSSPTSPTHAQSGSSLARGGRPYLLSAADRNEILPLVKRGCSRRSVAPRIGCSPNTIARTAARDPDFARQFACAETDLPHHGFPRKANWANTPPHVGADF